MRVSLCRFAAVLTLLCTTLLAHAQATVPAPLEPWRDWVLKDQEFRHCPLIAGRGGAAATDFVCAWPGVLALTVDASGADFRQHWDVKVEGWIPLPGSSRHWPQGVTLDGQPLVVVDRNGPVAWVGVGNHELRGHIAWQQRPQSLRVPRAAGIVALHIDGKPITPVRQDGDDLNLGRGASTAPEADSLELRVFRRLDDGVPATLTTLIQLRASGQVREASIGPALPDGFVPVALDGTWPARLDADGRLRVRLQPGSDTLRLQARATAPLAEVDARLGAAPWPRQEIWSYAAAPRLRVSVASGALPVDPQQSDVPSEWQELPAFALGDGGKLTIDERSRGAPGGSDNRYTLQREMWLDFDGAGWFARDRLQGRMQDGWRLDAAAPLRLERARIPAGQGGSGESLLVTRGADPALRGVEWRLPQVNLDAGLRIADATTRLPVTGWLGSFDEVNTVLHVPDGYRLLGAPGADHANGSWISAWTLLDVFLAAILVLLAWRAFGAAAGAAMLAYLLLGYQESGAPLWTLLCVLLLALLLRALPTGRLAVAIEWLRRGALAALLLVALPFMAAQLRYALYPQLESSGSYGAGDVATETFAPAVMDAPAPLPASAPMVVEASRARSMAGAALESVTVTGTRVEPRKLGVLAESTLVQTGSGEPDWQRGHRYELGWSGPVLAGQHVQLVIAPPWLVRSLRVLLVALLALLLGLALRPQLRIAVARLRGGAAAGLLALLAAGTPTPAPAQTQGFPPESLLAALKARLTEAPRCAPTCASLANATISARGDDLVITLDAHAATAVALPLPFDERTLGLLTLRVDGVARDAIARSDDLPWLELARGVHRVELAYGVSGGRVALRFPLQPRQVRFNGDGWQAAGLADGRLQTETLTLSRAQDPASGEAPRDEAQRFAPFVRVHRLLVLAADWQLETRVERIAPTTGGFTVAVPLLPGEHVTSDGIKVDAGVVHAAIADGEDAVEWNATLDRASTLQLVAPALDAHAETWTLQVGTQWHVDYRGVPVVVPEGEEDATTEPRLLEFDPLPGETLTLAITRPEAADGPTRAIDGVRVDHELGQRAATTTLTLTLRASQGGEQAITLPAAAELLAVRRDGETLNLRLQDARLSLPVQPGQQRFEVSFRDPQPLTSRATTPALALGLPAANIDLHLTLPRDRWLLATSGPATGPAVLYWGELAMLLLVAFGLSRLPHSPLKPWQWILLGIGFSTYSWGALLVVVGWLFALDWRARASTPRGAVAFNLVQLALVLLTLVALTCLFDSIRHGLLGAPDMHVTGNGSSQHDLAWFADRSADALPVARALSLPLWSYQLAMLAWALWLASALMRWLRKGFAAWTRGGYWRQRPRPVVEVPQVDAPPPPAA